MDRKRIGKWTCRTLTAAIVVCALVAAFGFAPRALSARAADEVTLASALSAYAGYSESNDLLSVPTALRMETTGDNQTGDATFDGKELKLSNSRAHFASAKLTNDCIESGVLQVGSQNVALTQVPLLYRATVKIDKMGADAWKGAGLFLGVTAEGYGVGLRLMRSGGMAFWLSNAGNRRDETEVATIETGVEQGKSYRFALIKDGDVCKVFIDEKQVAVLDLESVRTDTYKMSVQIQKVGFGAHQRGTAITVSDFALIPLIDCALPENVCAHGENFAAVSTATVTAGTEKEIEIRTDNGKLYALKAGSSWEYEAVDENVAGTRVAFKVSASSVGVFGIKFKTDTASALCYEFADGAVKLVRKSGATETVLQSAVCALPDGDITIFSDLYTARIDCGAVSMRTKVSDATGMRSTIAFYTTDGDADVRDVRCEYGAGYLAQRPTDNEYVDRGPSKDVAGSPVSVSPQKRSMPAYALALITSGAAILAIGAAALITMLVIKNKNKKTSEEKK